MACVNSPAPDERPPPIWTRSCGAGEGGLKFLPRKGGSSFRLSKSFPSSVSPRSRPMSFTLPELPYPYDALGPYMSRETLEYHHDKHHLAYVNNGNNAIKGTEWEGKPLEEIVKGSFGKNPAVFNNAGQHYNHTHFWKWMKPNGGGSIPGEVEKALKDSFGSVDKAKEDLIQAGVTQFGSGWCWLTLKG